LALTIPVLLGAAILIFLLMQLIPGDAVTAKMTGGAKLSPEQQAEMREALGLNRSVVVQLGDYLWGLVRGDLGRSVAGRSVFELIAAQIPSTLILVGAGMMVALVIGVPLGVLAARRRNTLVDTTAMGTAVLGLSIPQFWLGLMFVILFAVNLGWFPVLSSGGFDGLVLPALSLGLAEAAILARLVRSSLIESLEQDYITTARAKGASDSRVTWRHGLRNAMVPVVTMIGLQVGNLLGASVVIETLFGRQGVGKLIVDSILQREIAILQGSILVLAFLFVMINVIVDILYKVLDPRVKLGTA
jgi:peptide/nickel transport system permease protein